MGTVKRLVAVGAVAGALLVTAQHSLAAFELKKSQGPSPDEQKAVFDESEFSMWVDNTYRAVVTYGQAPDLTTAPTYGDPMPLSDALKILAPDRWKVMRARNLDLEGRLVVSWDLKEATWLDALTNLGERHGLQFHVDFNRKQVFVKNGRKMVFDRPEHIGLAETYPAANPGRVFDKNPSPAEVEQRQVVSTKSFVNLNDDNPDESVYNLKKGESAKLVVEDLTLLHGYERFHWLINDQTVVQSETYVGDANDIMGQVVSKFYGRLCLYEADKIAAVIPKNMECPRDEQP